MNIVHAALEKGNGHTILSTGITGDDARLAKAVVNAGVETAIIKAYEVAESQIKRY